MKNTLLIVGIAALAACALAQPDPETQQQSARSQLNEAISRAELEGIEVRIKDIARFRGVRPNQLVGYGIVVGLNGSGDSQQTPFTRTLLQNALKLWGTTFDETRFRPKNVAAVSITAELPPFAAPGNQIDVTISSIGDAKSLEGGTLLMSPLFGPTDRTTVIAMSQGQISIGGFNASAGGTSVRKNHPTVGRIPRGAIVERGVPTQMVFGDHELYLELDQPDLTTSQRIATALAEKFPKFFVTPQDGGTIRIKLPEEYPTMQALMEIEATTVWADVPALIVVNERTGTIVIGGNVRIGPAVIVHGSLQVRIESQPIISQPAPFSQGETVVTEQNFIDVEETPTQIGVIPPNATINDLAKILQTLKLSARDIIAILQALADQGALKARIKVQ